MEDVKDRMTHNEQSAVGGTKDGSDAVGQDDGRWAAPRDTSSGVMARQAGNDERSREEENVPPQLLNGDGAHVEELQLPKGQADDTSENANGTADADLEPCTLRLHSAPSEPMTPGALARSETAAQDEVFSKASNSSGSVARGYRSGVPSPAMYDATRASTVPSPSLFDPSRDPLSVNP